MIIGGRGCLGPSFCQGFLPVRDDGYGRGEDVKEFAMGDIDDPEEARDDMEVPEEVCVDFDISQELRCKVTCE
jgi:hypothetical protein